MPEIDITTLLADAASRAARYLAEIRERGVGPGPDALAGLARLAPALPERGLPADEVLALLDEAGSPATLGTAGPRFFGFVIGGSLPVTVAACILATAWDQNAGLRITSPVSAALEEAAIRWLLERYEFPFTSVSNTDLRAGDLFARDMGEDRQRQQDAHYEIEPDVLLADRFGEVPPQHARDRETAPPTYCCLQGLLQI